MSDKVTCPLDPVHVVERHKLVFHLSRCIRTYRGGQHVALHCPFDHSHVVEAGQMEAHVRQCPQLALALPLLDLPNQSGGAGPSVVTGNLRMPEQPGCIDQLVTAEWDVDNHEEDVAPLHQQHRGGAAAAPGFDAASTTTGTTATALGSAGAGAAFGFGRGRGRGRVPDVVGGVGGGPASGANAARSVDEELRPGEVAPGGYVIKALHYPAGFGPRGRHEERGCV